MARLSNKVKLVAKLTISFGILFVLFSRLDWQQARMIVTRANLLLLVLPILLLILDRVWMAWKWRILLAVVSRPPSFYETVRVYYISSFQGNALPFGGLGPDLVRYFQMRSSRISSHSVGISIVIERIIGLLATIILAIVASVLLSIQGNHTETTRVIIGSTILCGSLGIIVIASLLFSRPLQRYTYHCLARIKFLARRPSFAKLVNALRRYRNEPRILVLNLVLALLEQFFEIFAFLLGAWAFGVHLNLIDCLAVLPFSTLLQRLPISYAGLGIREGTQVFLFGLIGIKYADVLVVSSALFFVLLISLLPGAFWSFTNDRSNQFTRESSKQQLRTSSFTKGKGAADITEP